MHATGWREQYSFDLRAGEVENTNPCRRPTGHSVAVEDIDEDIDWSSTNRIICFTETIDAAEMTTTACSDFDERFFFEAGRCYPQSGAPLINMGASWFPISDTGTPQECYDYCKGTSGYMGLELRPADSSRSSNSCWCNRPSASVRERQDQRSNRAQVNPLRKTITYGGLVRHPPARRWQ